MCDYHDGVRNSGDYTVIACLSNWISMLDPYIAHHHVDIRSMRLLSDQGDVKLMYELGAVHIKGKSRRYLLA